MDAPLAFTLIVYCSRLQFTMLEYAVGVYSGMLVSRFTVDPHIGLYHALLSSIVGLTLILDCYIYHDWREFRLLILYCLTVQFLAWVKVKVHLELEVMVHLVCTSKAPFERGSTRLGVRGERLNQLESRLAKLAAIVSPLQHSIISLSLDRKHLTITSCHCLNFVGSSLIRYVVVMTSAWFKT